MNATEKKHINDEIRMMEKLSGHHPVLLELYDIKIDDSVVHIFLEYCDGGDLRKAMKNKDIRDEADIKYILEQLLSCLAYIHSYKVAHCDIKPDNIAFLSKTSNKIQRLQLVFDFRLGYKIA